LDIKGEGFIMNEIRKTRIFLRNKPDKTISVNSSPPPTLGDDNLKLTEESI
jgi:hypothetical protein